MKISVIISVYNRKNELFELLKSLSNQTCGDFEVIVVDDGSTLDIKSTINIFRENLNISYFYKDNTGAGTSRNFGADKAVGDWLIFLDSDVITPKNYIENVYKNIVKFPCDAFGGADKAHSEFNVLQKAISYSMTSMITTGGIRGNRRAINKFQPRSFNMGVKKDVFLDVGGFSDMRIGEDPDFSMTLWEKGYKTAFYEDIVVFHKRRSRLSKFSKQVYNFGIARPILNQRHSKYTKPSFWFPSIFLIGYFISIIHYFLENNNLLLIFYGIYTFIVFVHSSIINKSLSVGSLSVITTYVQMFSYGYGFLESWIKLNIFKKDSHKAFPNHFA